MLSLDLVLIFVFVYLSGEGGYRLGTDHHNPVICSMVYGCDLNGQFMVLCEKFGLTILTLEN